MQSTPHLTDRELEILHLLLSGLTNKGIAAALRISQKTVEFHLDHIYTKTGARSRLMAGMWALRQGIAVGPAGVRE